jgi:cytochrome c biogenesis protein CcdA/thiol-disulfide isomerase/thioredoxin
VLTLLVIGLLSGIVTGLSPCVLPVLPALLTTSAAGPEAGGSMTTTPSRPDRRRPLTIVAGLVTSFALVTLLGASALSALGLPPDLLRNVGIAAMVVMGIGLLLPAVGHALERPFARVSRVGPRRTGPAFAIGMTLGVVFVPCAGPVLAAITVLAATNQVESGLIALTAAFAAGIAIPLTAFALAGQQMAERIAAVRTRMPALRRITGGVLVATALAVVLGLPDQAQRLIPPYVATAQEAIEDNAEARAALGTLAATQGPAATETLSFNACEADPSRLADCGPARDFVGIQQWLNTPAGSALTLDGLKGRVVLVDFWTYSCINCQRTLPYLTDWDRKYRDAGLTIVGVHSPEFAFEHEVDNVVEAAAASGIEYPIALDNDFRTWRAYNQRYWPAHYLIDRDGVVRQVHYGEGAYDDTERLIRELLG